MAQAVADPWPTGSCVKVSLKFRPGLTPLRADPENDGIKEASRIPEKQEDGLDELLDRYRAGLAMNPFLKIVPFLIPLRPGALANTLVDGSGKTLPWKPGSRTGFRVECICAGTLALMAGEWDGRDLNVLSILDGETWTSLNSELRS